MLPYQIIPDPTCTRAWLKRVEGVTPAKGNGWDVQGPFIPPQGMGEEGWLLCLGEQYERQTLYWVFRIELDAPRNCRRLCTSRQPPLSFAELEEAHKAFPQLSPVLHKSIARCLWVLLHELAKAQPTRTKRPMSLQHEGRKLRLD